MLKEKAFAFVTSAAIAFLLLDCPSQLKAQGPYQPFGADAELLETSICNHTTGCPSIDLAAQAGVQWLRMFAIWNYIEPSNGVFNWSNNAELPWQVWYAQQKGIQVYFTATWAPQWANGAVSTCPPFAGANQTNAGSSTLPQCQNGYQDVGRTVTNSQYTYNFFSALVTQFNGSNVSGCPTNNASTCHPLVQYFGVWNEPNGMNNYNDTYYDPGNLGNYLNDYVNQYLFPAHQAIKAANPSAYVVAPDISDDNSTCGGFSGSCSWNNSWIKPLTLYFSQYFDVISMHSYPSSASTVQNYVQTTWNSYDYAKPIWMTEVAIGSASQLELLYEDEYNRSSYWAKTFWTLGQTTACGSADALICQSGGMQVANGSFFADYAYVYGPH